MMEIGDLRKRVVHAIDQAKREAAAHRAEADRARDEYREFLERTAAPLFRQLAQALRAEGYPFQVFTPAGSVRLASDRSADDYLEIQLDASRQRVTVVGRVSHTRGRRVLTDEEILLEGDGLSRLTDEDILAFVLRRLAPFVER